ALESAAFWLDAYACPVKREVSLWRSTVVLKWAVKHEAECWDTATSSGGDWGKSDARNCFEIPITRRSGFAVHIHVSVRHRTGKGAVASERESIATKLRPAIENCSHGTFNRFQTCE